MNLELKNVTKRYGGFTVDALNLTVTEGEFFVLLGPSGSGKTVILEMIAGLQKPDHGTVRGMTGRRIGFIYQDYMLFPHMNVFANIAYGLKIAGLPKTAISQRVRQTADEMDIAHLLERDVRELSGGEKQRTAIARAMATVPDIYLFDEPTAALDRGLRIKTRLLFRQLHRSTGRTFLHVTHDFEEALALADRIGILLNGRLVQVGRPEDIFHAPGSKEVADFLGYRNVFAGSVKNYCMTIAGIAVSVPREHAEQATIAIRSDDILLSREKISSSARNSLPGRIQEVFPGAAGVELSVDVGFPLTVEITRRSYEEMDLKQHDPVWATFKVSAVQVFRH